MAADSGRHPAAGPAYAELARRFRRLYALGGAESVLHWDTATMMPDGGASARGEQLAHLRAVQHQMLCAPDLDDLLAAAETDRALGAWERANLREMRRQHSRAVAVPEALVEALAQATTACEMTWRSARDASDFGQVAGQLADVLRLTRESAEATGARLGLAPYDALLDLYEPGLREADLAAPFATLAAELPGLLGAALERQAALPPPRPPEGPFPIESQRALAVRLMEALGFDFRHGRLDVSRHPFCGGIADDVRITTRYDEADFTSGLMGVLHETGHALYEQGLPAAWRTQPVGQPRSMGVHESQSLLIEMQVCRGEAFLAFAAPLMGEAFAGADDAWRPGNLARLYTRVERGFIRVDADEVTYPLHVLLRFDLERALIKGDLRVADLPGAWNAGMERLLGIVPPDDRRGCLQDLHWFLGSFGYFPTYTLGALMAAQLYAEARRAIPDLEAEIARGVFAPLLAWLRARVHGKASLLEVPEWLQEAAGKSLDPNAFLDHLRARYLP